MPENQTDMHLWISLYFNYLPIEVIPNSNLGHASEPRAVLTGQGRGDRVLICSPAAGSCGIRPGQPVNAALALVPELELLPRDIDREEQALEELAGWAIRYTPAVSIAAPDALLLDIHASLKFFGGFERLRELLLSDLETYGYRVTVGCAPTALAALWFARTGNGAMAFKRAELPGRLATLPVGCLHWPKNLLKMFREMGIRTLGESARLPRDGFAQRFGPEKLLELDRGFGRAPEALEFYRPPKVFHATQELPVETTDGQLLLESLQRLLGQLRTFLIVNQGSIQVLWVHLYHYGTPATLIRIGLLRPATDTGYLLELARIRFNDLRFSAPVISIALQTDLLEICRVPGTDLFGGHPDDAAAALALMEQLQLRLSSQAVYGIQPVAEHRPELAWKAVAPIHSRDSGHAGGTGMAACTSRRPLWMLAEPVLLKMVADRPFFQEVLNLEGGPERIETGWWDGQDVRRDYYIARPASKKCQGMRLWIFRDCRKSRWYLHGFFG